MPVTISNASTPVSGVVHVLSPDVPTESLVYQQGHDATGLAALVLLQVVKE